VTTRPERSALVASRCQHSGTAQVPECASRGRRRGLLDLHISGPLPHTLPIRTARGTEAQMSRSNQYVAVVNPNRKLAGRCEVLSLGPMGRRVVMPRDRAGRFVSLRVSDGGSGSGDL
jgi:hypothetical protein